MLNFVKLQPWGGVAISTSHLTSVNTVIYRPSDRMTTLTGMLTDTCMHIHMTQTHTNANTHTTWYRFGAHICSGTVLSSLKEATTALIDFKNL